MITVEQATKSILLVVFGLSFDLNEIKDAGNMQNNLITVSLKEFNHAMKTFKLGVPRKNAKKKPIIPPAVLSFFDGILTIESDEKLVNIRATGEWHGKAEFSNSIVNAIAMVPLSTNPLVIKYTGEKLLIGSTSVTCKWTLLNERKINQLSNPSVIDIFAMYRTLPAHQAHADGIAKKYKSVHQAMLKETEKTAKKLSAYEITQEDLITLIEAKTEAKISSNN
ncbi:MAG: hypothetical protein HOO90_07560 [Methylotenera sp.]|uniref:hypothetical protein n=1 Tax=Methylotenera sp. TaxID=2051956 RepID=UPI00178DF5AC|nr:hypothetical protein [Methylotenera sp.]NOU25377.1 hypothetical protein [Methylotenera sp.]